MKTSTNVAPAAAPTTAPTDTANHNDGTTAATDALDARTMGEVAAEIAAGPDTPLDIVRRGPVMQAAHFPGVPNGYVPIPADGKHALLKLPADQHAEVKEVLQEIAAKGVRLREELGPMAPDWRRAPVLLGQMEQARQATAKAKAAAAYCVDKEDVIDNDAEAFIAEVKGDLAYVTNKKPNMAAEYPKLMALVTQRRDAIVDGRAAAAKAKAAAADEKPAGK